MQHLAGRKTVKKIPPPEAKNGEFGGTVMPWDFFFQPFFSLVLLS